MTSTLDRTRVLIPIGEPIGGQMSAVGIRQYEVGKALAEHCAVTFASASADNDTEHGIPVASCRTRSEFHDLLRRHDVLYTLGLNSDRFLDVVMSGVRVVFDIYTPLAYEILEAWPELPTHLLARMHRRVSRWTSAQIMHADFIVCQHERQRDMWLGVMNAIGRLTAVETRRNPNCRHLIDVSSFGVPAHAPVRRGTPLRDRLPGLGPGDFLLLWSSKILAWQDPATLLRAMHLLRNDEPNVRLVFLGTGPIPTGGRRDWLNPASLRTRQAVELAGQLGLTDSTVFFITDRIPYRDIGAYYLDADAAVSTYPDSLETRFCLGTRLLDYVWAGLPMVISGCELQREFVEGQRLGFFVPPGDPHALAHAIRLVKDTVIGGGGAFEFEVARRRLQWSTVTRPIIDYCVSPAARSGRMRRHMLSARMQHAEFMVRSAAIRAGMALGGVPRG